MLMMLGPCPPVRGATSELLVWVVENLASPFGGGMGGLHDMLADTML